MANEVKKFDREMIRVALKKRELNFLTDQDGDFHVNFSYDDDWGCELKILLMIQGQQQDIFTISVTATKKIPKEDFGRAIMLCNEWNRTRLFPLAFLAYNDNESTGNIFLQYHLDTEKGIHQEFIDYYVVMIMSTAMKFWKWVHQEKAAF